MRDPHTPSPLDRPENHTPHGPTPAHVTYSCLLSIRSISQTTGGRWFCDASGRVRIFHGFNDVEEAKQSGPFDGGNFLPHLMMEPAHVQQLSDWGFNVMRMPMMWSAIQPSADQFSTAYLSAIRNITEHMGSRGLFSFLDMHQDVLSSLLGSYDGTWP